MADGLFGKLKIGAIIQARMKSSRLPGKILLPLPYPSGRPLLTWIVNAIKQSQFVNQVILATSVDPGNDCLEKFSLDQNIILYRGSEDDVLSRFTEVVIRHELDIVIRLTGDNPIVDVKILDETIQHHISHKNDYTKTIGLPIGMNFEIISGKVLVQQSQFELLAEHKEHVTLFIRNDKSLRKGELHPLKSEDLSSIRLTVDYPSDFAALSFILSLAEEQSPDISLIQKLRSTSGWIFKINTDNFQRQQFSNRRDEIQNAISHLQKIGMNTAAQVLKKYDLS